MQRRSMVGVPADDSCVNHNRFMRSPWRAALLLLRGQRHTYFTFFYSFVLFKAVF